jgi:F0F1-type ATP synthase membrane subunit c/vacuolar-type H+-ATPase subunit K
LDSQSITLVFVFALCVLGPSGVIAAAVFASINALGRNPSAAPKIFTAMIVSIVFAEAMAIVGFLVSYQLFSQ